jgi:hypothetical protein
MQNQLIPVELVTEGLVQGGLQYTVSPKLNVLLGVYTYSVHKRKHAKDDGKLNHHPARTNSKQKQKEKKRHSSTQLGNLLGKCIKTIYSDVVHFNPVTDSLIVLRLT